jgi:3-dehydroquinate dehydratase-2
MTTIFVLNGPNLNLLGRREPALYGAETLDGIADRCRAAGARLGLEVVARQTNHEGVLVEWVHEARDAAQGLVVNAGAYTHTSVALHDALRAFDGPIVEVHLSNVHRREAFRHHSYVALAATGTISGLGPIGYVLALEALAERLATTS